MRPIYDAYLKDTMKAKASVSVILPNLILFQSQARFLAIDERCYVVKDCENGVPLHCQFSRTRILIYIDGTKLRF